MKKISEQMNLTSPSLVPVIIAVLKSRLVLDKFLI
jgi:hypothetical protein